MRSEGATGALSSYSSEISATTPALPLPPAPALQGTATSSSQVHLSWSTTATGIVLFSIERRTTTGGYSQVSQPTATSTSFDDSGLTGSTMYLYRMRVQTGAGFSVYSNEVIVATLQAIPAAPTNLQATAVSSSQVNLTWTNNAPDATAIRVEYLPRNSTTFTDIGAAVTLTGTGIASLQPNTTYSFRVRAQNAAGYSAYSNVATATSLPIPTTVFLVHGIGQGSRNMLPLKQTLESNLDNKRYAVNATFEYGYCAASPSCNALCSISDGAYVLASTILSATSPGGNVIIIGYSMGGLMARDMVAHNYGGITTSRKITALLTLGTPNLGYPYGSLDASSIGSALSGTCPLLSQQMYSDFRSQQSSRSVVLSKYLSDLINIWNDVSASSYSGYWLAISGGYCKQPLRTGDLTMSLGCPDYNVVSDGVVCDQSGRYNFSGFNTPNQTWYGDPYAHATKVIMCAMGLTFSSGNAPLLFDPYPGDPLSQTLWNAIKAH
jgi:pimeloyl-ACP methyl ester carboxylesterase